MYSHLLTSHSKFTACPAVHLRRSPQRGNLHAQTLLPHPQLCRTNSRGTFARSLTPIYTLVLTPASIAIVSNDKASAAPQSMLKFWSNTKCARTVQAKGESLPYTDILRTHELTTG